MKNALSVLDLTVEKGIDCSFLPDLPAQLDLDMVRLCSLIANTLDNAIEANEKITPASRRRIFKARKKTRSFTDAACRLSAIWSADSAEP